MITRRNATLVLGTSIVGGISGRAIAAPGVVNKNGFALDGYDSAAFWTARDATMGKPAFSFRWRGVNWIFANQANRDAFAASPEKYAPAFNGYCPFCLAGGRLVAGIGRYWDIYQAKLYLLLSSRIHDDFVMKRDYYIERATTYWAKLS